MKLLKRLVKLLVVSVLLLGVAAFVVYRYGIRGTPDWLRRPIATAAERAAAANRLDQKIMEALSVVREMDAYDHAPQTRNSSDKRPSATRPASKLQVSFTEDELNASFQKWDQLYGWTDRYRGYVQDPSIVLHEGRIILAGNSEELGTVVSLHFEPELDAQGNLSLTLSHVLAGRLPVPQAFFDKYRNQTRARLMAALPGLQRKAEFKADGSANLEAMSAAMAKLFLRVLANEPGEAALFLPVATNRSVPVRLTDVKIVDKSLSLTVKPLNSAERAGLLSRIREPFDKETAQNANAQPKSNSGS